MPTIPRTALVVLLLLVAPGCARREPTAADVVRASGLRFLPDDTAGVAVIEVARIEDREALARWLGEGAKGLMGEGARAPLAAILGGDLLDKVDRVAVALVPEGGSPPGWAALVEGRFDAGALSAGDTIVPLVAIGSGPEVSMTRLPGNVVAVGPRPALERVRAVSAQPGVGLAAAPLMKILASVSPAGQAWGGIDYAPLAALAAGGLRGPGSVLPLPDPRSPGALRGVAFEGRVAAEVGFTLVGVADAEPGARQLADGARGLVALARMGAAQGNDPTWLGFLDGLRIDQAGAEVRVRGTVSGPMLQALAARMTGPAPVPGRDPSGAAPGGGPGATAPR